MPPVTRLGDIGSGHGSFPPTANISGSPDTIVNGLALHRVGDALAPHGSPSPAPPHGRVSAVGSPDTIINGKPATRIGDAIACGGIHVNGSPDTIIN